MRYITVAVSVCFPQKQAAAMFIVYWFTVNHIFCSSVTYTVQLCSAKIKKKIAVLKKIFLYSAINSVQT